MMTMLTFAEPVLLKDHFLMPADTTPWPAVGTGAAYVGTKPGMTPARDRAPFRTQAHGMLPRSEYGESLAKTYGLYVLAFGGGQGLTPSIYVGITVRESVLVRIRKHRVKATGSHVGGRADVYGGVNHTERWRPFAEQRHIEHAGRPDQCADVRLLVGQLSLPVAEGAPLRRFEASLCSDQDGVLKQLKEMLWSGAARRVSLLTEKHGKAFAGDGMRIVFWNGQTKVFS
ncbi:hypothetical protein PKB_5487 [Pseudomonas knackmussii B13]|uniref:Uncharacterized protein n=1 Tax=Pseudomonas knackmussii (strain DSM 6978 / CCUG 54928 / LMG 23759 / B13) TaxID=1301098 RepID=A0A024HQE0_PSEKB|nr:hypothetical protein [Pseudomonas knackmussii]CDF86797.1 hypothetical protein PKB_5487 [Pseudomonas knackmussii B13]